MQDSELITPAYDRHMDGAPTRRELQKAFNKMGNNDSELMLMVDNLNLVTNLLCEKLNVTKGEIEVYVAKKAAEMNAFVEAQAKAAAEAADVITNG
jgi:hypothetical protein